MSDISHGFRYLMQGARLLLRSELRIFVLLPLLINVLLFALGVVILLSYAGGWVNGAVNQLPHWLAWAAWLLWLVLTLLVIMSVFWGFNFIANMIAAPFNGLLAEKTQQLLTGKPVDGGHWSDLIAMVPGTLARECHKWMYFFPRVMLLFVLGWVPVVNLIMPWIWLLFGAWMMAIQYVDYPMDNNKISFKVMTQRLGKKKLLHLSFGGAVSLMLLVPLVNLLVMPIAVVGATLLWVERHAEELAFTPTIQRVN